MDEEGQEQWPSWYPDKAVILNDLTKKQLFVVENKNNILAIVALSPTMPPEYNKVNWNLKEGKVNSIHRLAVHPTLKTKSLAHDLLQYIEGIAREDGYSIIRLDTYSPNKRANIFYQKNGYHYCGDINLQYMPKKYRCYEKAIC
jgi:ribosomal protein S18 acetylase RimI-like enzyme